MTVGSITPTSGVASTSGSQGSYGRTVNQYGLGGVASLLGESVQQLQSQTTSQSLAQFIQANGLTAQQFAQAYLSGVQSGLSNDVAAGTITQQQADTILTNQTNRINARLQLNVSNPDLGANGNSSGAGAIVNASA